MKIIGIIPARWGSKRFPGKLLQKIERKSIICWVYERAKKAKMLDDCIVATDDQRIVKEIENINGKIILTNKNYRSGTDRISDVAKNFRADIIINIQGDEPLIKPQMINEVAQILIADKKVVMGTLIQKISNKDDFYNPNVVKVVIDKNNFAIYFSRAPIPFSRDNKTNYIFKHIGIYAYRKNFLIKFSQLPESHLEKIEKLEQLRALENGYKIKVKETKYTSIGIDTKEDLIKVKKIMREL